MSIEYKDLFEFLELAPKPWYILVVGAPGCGKTTVAQALIKKYKIVRFSTDDKLELMHKRGRLPDFDKIPFGAIVQAMKQQIWQTTNMGHSILLDQTSMTRESRMRKLAWAPPHYITICIDLSGYSVDQLDERVKTRVKNGGRHIPRHVIADMLAKYERPMPDEGFRLIYRLTP